jgi:UDP-3-O-[3-hydroxymyristoyl] glucosamine N-acyltransferase
VKIKLKQLAEKIGGELVGDGEILVDSAAPIDGAGNGQITFLANPKYEKYLDTTAASAVILKSGSTFDRLPVIKHENPYYAYALTLDILYPEEITLRPGIDPTAIIADSAQIGKDCTIGALTCIGDRAVIGENSVIYAQTYIANDVHIGKNCRIYPGVKILGHSRIGDNIIIHSGVVIGSDGFGFARHAEGIKKVKQIGWVEIGDHVEIGANCTIDRGALGPTKIGNHVKIDNLVQIAHNVEIGDYSIIISQVGISGSTKLGKGVVLAGQVGLVGHIELGDGVQVGAQSGVNHDIPAGKSYFGYPARDKSIAMRIEACISKLPELFKRVRKLEKNKD